MVHYEMLHHSTVTAQNYTQNYAIIPIVFETNALICIKLVEISLSSVEQY